MSKLPIGIQLFTVRDLLPEDYRGTVKALGEMGYTHVELAQGFFGHTVDELNEIFAEAGVVPISAHVGTNVLSDDLGKAVSDYAALKGLRYIVIPWITRDNLAGGENYQSFLKLIAQTAAECKKYGITLLYHNHDFEFQKLDGEYLLDILYKDNSPEVLKTQIDTCWARVGGEDPAKYLLKYAGRAPLVHIKDSAGDKSGATYELIDGGETKKAAVKNDFELRPVGYGTQDVLSIIKASEAVGAECVIVEQDFASLGYTSLESAKLSIDYIKNIYK